VITSKPLPEPKIFPFNSLPAEVRELIYVLALTDPNFIFLVTKYRDNDCVVRRDPSRSSRTYRGWNRSDNLQSATNPVSTLVPNLLALSHQNFNEAQPILYGKNAFAVENSFALHAFLANIRPRNVAILKDMAFKGWGTSKLHSALNYPAFTLLASAVNLKRLHIDCRIGANQLYYSGIHWFKAVGQAKGKFDAAVDIIELEEKYVRGKIEAYRNELRGLLRQRVR
jgi:hypothetical protein